MRELQFHDTGSGIFNTHSFKKAAVWMVLLLLMMGFMQAGVVFGQDFASGDGSEGDPYQIETWEHLDNVRGYLDSHFILNNDLTSETDDYDTYASSSANGGLGWEPIGSDSTPFSGYFDGDENLISGLTINRGSQDSIGLFGYISLEAEIKNIGLEDVSIAGDDIVGALAGTNEGNVSNAYSTGVFTSTYSEAGGLVGHNRGLITESYSEISISVPSGGEAGGLVGFNFGTIENSYATGTITGYEYIGGFVANNEGTIKDSYATGNISAEYGYSGSFVGYNNSSGNISESYAQGNATGDDDIGGFVGYNYKGTISNSYAAGDVSSYDNAGGFLGDETGGEISNSYSTGSVTCLDSDCNIGGFAGYLSSGTITDSYYNSETSGQSDTGKGEPKTTAELKSLSTFSEWNIAFSDTELNDGYPFLGWQDEDDEATWLLFGEASLFCGGAGSEADPYLICTADQLNNIREDLTAHYKLANDIDLDVAPYNEGEGWEPIGDNDQRFNGSFDGSNHTISNLFIDQIATSNVGLFGVTDGATIENVGLVGVNVTGNWNVGGLMGSANGPVGAAGLNPNTIINAHVSGIVNGAGGQVGGLAGYFDGSITNSNAEADVTGPDYVGGLVGMMTGDGGITGSFATDEVNASGNHVGGLVGYNVSPITDSYAMGSVSGADEVGGLAGRNYDTITNTHATGAVAGNTDLGGLVGINDGGTVTASYYNSETSGQSDTGKGKPRTTAELNTLSTFSDWDIALTQTELNDGYPFLAWQDDSEEAVWLITEVAPLFCGGDGTEADPYLICTADQLNNVREDLTAHYRLDNDIDLDLAPYNEGEGWEPIANYDSWGLETNIPFTGSFDGNEHSISGLFINRPEEYGVGLFCWAKGASFSNLSLTNVDVTGYVRVGALAGDMDPVEAGITGSVENVYVSGEVNARSGPVGGFIGRSKQVIIDQAISDADISGGFTGGSDFGGIVGNAQNETFISNSSSTGEVYSENMRAGGLTGTLWASSITNSFSTSNITGRSDTGGLVGSAGGGTASGFSSISKSYATGNVIAFQDDFTRSFFGGLVGNSSGTNIEDSYATGSVEGERGTGGLVGSFGGSANTITRSYSSGAVTGTELIGGLVGNYSSGIITNSFYDSQTSGQSDAGKGTPKTTAEMKQQSTFTTAGSDWDFTNLWAIESGDYISYPFFGNGDEAPEQDPPPGYVKVSGFDEAPRLFVTAGETTTVTVQHILFGDDESVTITQIPGHGDYALFLDGTAVDNNDVIQKSDVESGKLVYKTEDGVQPTTFIYDYDRFTYENSEQQRTLPIDLAAQTMPYGFSEGWFLFSSPGEDQTVGELLDNIRTEGYPGSTNPGASFPTVYTLDQENYQWAAVTNSNQVLVQGAGLLVYVFEEDTPVEGLLFSEGPWATLDGSFTYDDLLWYDPDQGPQGNSHFLIGNPHPVGINICDMLLKGTNMATSIDIWVPMENDGNGGYVNFSCDVPAKAISSYTQPDAQNEEIRLEGVLPPFIGFWVRTTDDNPSLAITESDYISAVGKQNKVKAEPVTLVLSHEDRNYSNTVNILFSDRGSEGLDRIDAIKLSSAGLAQRYLSFYAMDDEGRKYALRSLPALAGDEATIPLGIETTEEGSYSMMWSLPGGENSGASYYLRDLSSGTTTQLMDGQSYSFELEAAAVSKATDSTLSVVLETQSAAKEGAPRFELIVTTRELADNGTELPSEIVLRQNYPNPFNPSTVIQYELPQPSAVRLAVFDMAGRKVAELVNGQIVAGSHSITFNAGSLSSGVYMYRLQAGGTLLTRKLTIIK